MNARGYDEEWSAEERRGRPGGWPEEADRLLCEILLDFENMPRLHFRLEVLAEMGRSPHSLRINQYVDELTEPRAHVRKILRAIGSWRDPLAALGSLCAALDIEAGYDGAMPWLELTERALSVDTGLPAGILLRVIRLLRELTPPPGPEQLRRHLPDGVSGLALLPPRASLPEILRRLLDRRGPADPAPVLHFLHGLSTDPALAEQPVVPALQALLGRVGAGRATAGEALASRLIVQIRLDPETPEHLDRTRYLLRASYYRQPLTGGPFRRVDTLADTEPLAKDELVTEGSARLAGWTGLARAMQAGGGGPVRIEFLLPTSLLGHRAELWAPSRYGQRLGHHHPVVVRSLERYADPWVNREPWRERWRHMLAESMECDAVDRIEWPPLTPEQAAGLSGWLAGRPTLACMALDRPYDELAPRVRAAVFDAIMFGGIPAILWRRGAGDPAELVKALREHSPSSLVHLPEAVHQHRRLNRAEEERDGIALLWDDPDCVDPDQDAPFAGMA
ncbi:hypothetical protein GCM10010193_16890 [Kitasatospora atroaurantiaca]|uniref:vWA-MoxR associated protein C-terminal domain-containing protein n=1 Tax=Kitasatospora atroaurantiaca TaxID=285545 RepID=A0A561EXB0_9ACTN|nr:hypothetical protein [Kitasatospora atroaurantiaca]TWE20255.1 hypothetical protein FB465_5402 [Kitasatospora atroaurantiaca]